MQLFTTAVKKQSEALSMPCLSSHNSNLKMEGGFGLHYTTTIYLLKRFFGQHSGPFIAMKKDAEYVPFRLPNEFTR
eukprot:7762412-Ditylum_brightwellii.AAC.2